MKKAGDPPSGNGDAEPGEEEEQEKAHGRHSREVGKRPGEFLGDRRVEMGGDQKSAYDAGNSEYLRYGSAEHAPDHTEYPASDENVVKRVHRSRSPHTRSAAEFRVLRSTGLTEE